MQSTIGHIALNISFLIYVVLYLPQVLYNLKRRSTDGLSFLMHAILVVGYLTDLMYGFGRHMPWQYRLVDLIGLTCLTLQHIQFGLYSKPNKGYWLTTIALLGLFVGVLYSIWFPLSATIYIQAGTVAWATGVFYTLPQIWKNYRFSSALGVSVVFIYFDIISSLCDSISAWTLGWDFPSKLGSPIEVILGCFLLCQFYAYRSKLKICHQV